MKGKYTQIIRIERIQNERWYIQFLAHSRNLKNCLNKDTENCLYHGCSGNGERDMFLAHVLIGNTTIGDSSMKIRPVGFDSTTNSNHIFVTYHDAQA
ncbi:unnamed protein product [Rotaria socialis]|uniref:Uncharacterized protein n=1 Tax=Rotaria socialis TaxID=392032 RepID=A0A821BSA7_9BILA|nr:unnamed protein product [Rotaria socialis]